MKKKKSLGFSITTQCSLLVMSTFRFFVNETNLFFDFDHEKTNDSSFFTFTKLKY
jgi:hypothetical protein